MHRFFIDSSLKHEKGHRIDITDKDDIKHLMKVLRMRLEEHIEICDCADQEYVCEIIEIKQSKVKTIVVEVKDIKREANIEITLFQSLPKGQKMELILQKSVEIGLKSVVPMLTERCVTKIKDKKTEKNKLERWQKIMDEAAKQSKRGILPHIEHVVPFNEIESSLSEFDLVLIPHVLGEQKTLKQVLKSANKPSKIAILIGPEGGFTDKEVEKALSMNAQPITLGPRILRTETAGFVTSSIVMYELGDIGGRF